MIQKSDDRIAALQGRLVSDMGACVTGALIVLGDRLGLFEAMADGTPLTPKELAKKTGCHERYLREWLSAMAAAEYLDYDGPSGRFTLTPEQAAVFADENSPAFFVGAFETVQAIWIDEPKVAEAFRSGKGLGWHEHSHCLFRGTERFFRSGYNAYLLSSWIPALDGVSPKLKRGASVADVGCGHGASTILMAQAFPNSKFTGFDYHSASVDRAREAAAQAGVSDRVTFEVASAKDFPGADYDLVAMFDCLHDMGDPVGAGQHIASALAEDGTWLIVEPFAEDALEHNLNPVGRIFYGASTMICTPASLSQEVGMGLGAQAGEARLRTVVAEAGFPHFRRASQTPFNLVFEAKR